MSDKNTIIKAGGSSTGSQVLVVGAVAVSGYVLYKAVSGLNLQEAGGNFGAGVVERVTEAVNNTVDRTINFVETQTLTEPAKQTEKSIFPGEKHIDSTGELNTYSGWMAKQPKSNQLMINAANTITQDYAARVGKSMADKTITAITNEGRESRAEVGERFNNLSPVSKILVGVGQFITVNKAGAAGAKFRTFLDTKPVIDGNSGQVIGMSTVKEAPPGSSFVSKSTKLSTPPVTAIVTKKDEIKRTAGGIKYDTVAVNKRK